MSNFFSSILGQGQKNQAYDVKMKDFQKDPYYASSQDTLSKVGTDILNGNLPSYYKPIGDFNSPEFQSMLANVSKNIQQGVMNNAAISGTSRSGTVNTATGNALGNVIPGLTFQDYSRALQGRGDLLSFGANTLSGVRGAGIQQEGVENTYNTNKANFDLGKATYNNNFTGMQIANQGKANMEAIMAGAGAAGGGFGPMAAGTGGFSMGGFASGGLKGAGMGTPEEQSGSMSNLLAMLGKFGG